MEKYVTDINNGIYLKEESINENKKEDQNTITVFPMKEITSFLGFGGAITESSAYNYSKLSTKNKNRFLNDYYSRNGLNYQFGRLSIGSNDFSLKSFVYSNKKDLSDFNIDNDEKYVIPLVKDILNVKKISLIASPWSPPRMYKRLPILRWGIGLSKRYYSLYSDYLINFLKSYEKKGIFIQYLTMQNEPMARQKWDSCLFSLSKQKEFIYKYLIPKLDKTKVLLWDHNKDDLYNVFEYLYEDKPQIAGIAFHYYTGHNFNELKKIHEKYPDILMINSEMCCGYQRYDEKNWINSAEYYLNDIIGDLNMGVNAYLDWNILLDEYGGPTPYKNYVKSVLILKNDDYIKTPIYYYLYHVSHFLKNNDRIIVSKASTSDLKVLAIKNNQKIMVIVMNDSNTDISYNLFIDKEKYWDISKAHSIITYQCRY